MARGGWKLGGWGLCTEGWQIDEGSEFQSWGMKCWKLRLESLGRRRGGRRSVTTEEERVVRGWTVRKRAVAACIIYYVPRFTTVAMQLFCFGCGARTDRHTEIPTDRSYHRYTTTVRPLSVKMALSIKRRGPYV